MDTKANRLDLTQYHYAYNAAAHFQTQDKYPSGLSAAISQTGFAGFEATCWALETLSTQSELIRRDMHTTGRSC